MNNVFQILKNLKKKSAVFLCCGLFISLIYCGRKSSDLAKLPENISYNFHVRPILSDKCFTCHGPDENQLQASLRLDIPEMAKAPLKETPNAFAIIPFDSENSELIKRVTSKDSSLVMPIPSSHLGRLSEYEIEILKKWIDEGAEYEKHWAFIPPEKNELPDVDSDWPENEIDYFVLNQMKTKGLKPNPRAENDYLLKRLSLDITGTIPNYDLLAKVVNPNFEFDYEQVVDNFLASKQFGEKMAVYWLDLARYSDSWGYQDDNLRTQWPYRDWVIHAFNENIPYDQFIKWQLAGDMIPDASKEQILATAFLRNHKITEEGGVIEEEYRVEYILDKVKTYSKGIMGLTVECAQCHDHKYDPISQKNYFELYAFFNNSKEKGFYGDVSVSKQAKAPIIKITKEDVDSILTFVNLQEVKEDSVEISVMGELDTLRPTYILDRGLYDQPTNFVKASALPAVMDFDTISFQPNRLGLANWTIDENNPLTARVFVNHMWQEIFGRGLVNTSGDFGMQGELPSHPQLLDYLAVDFMENGWDVKYLIKKILMSASYRQSAEVSKKQLEIDPDNIYLSRAPRFRIKAEFIRDVVLTSSGLLNDQIGGPSVKPYQPEGLWEAASSGRGLLKEYKQDKGDKLYRRGLYTFIKLTVPPPAMVMFDASNRDQCEVKRADTNTPLQALIMMNDPLILEAARVLAQKLQKNETTQSEAIEQAFLRILCRLPAQEELTVLEQYYQGQKQSFTAEGIDPNTILNVGAFEQIETDDLESTAALMQTIVMIYNMEEAITKT